MYSSRFFGTHPLRGWSRSLALAALAALPACQAAPESVKPGLDPNKPRVVSIQYSRIYDSADSPEVNRIKDAQYRGDSLAYKDTMLPQTPGDSALFRRMMDDPTIDSITNTAAYFSTEPRVVKFDRPQWDKPAVPVRP